MQTLNAVAECLANLARVQLNPLDLIPRQTLAEKLIELTLRGAPDFPQNAGLQDLSKVLAVIDTRDVKVVVLGGGTGLSNIVGGDSRGRSWPAQPFRGLKAFFPKTSSIVCVTDDGGSTGELLQQLPVIALGDLRHVLVSSIQQTALQERYGLAPAEAMQAARILHALFNYRFSTRPSTPLELLEGGGIDLEPLPKAMRRALVELMESLFTDPRLGHTLGRPHCLGNLLLAASIYRQFKKIRPASPKETIRGLDYLASFMGANPCAVLPCTTTSAQLKVLYANGVLVIGEYKASLAKRGYPVDRVFVEFAETPSVPPEVLASVQEADIIVFAPGSLYTSIVPILQVPGLAEAVRENRQALKILVANLWVQRGETDLVHGSPERRFYVSDLIGAYHRNIPGGVQDLFHQVMVVGLQHIPGDILQRYAVEEKVPIYLDRERVCQLGVEPVESMIFSQGALRERSVIQHDPGAMAKAIRVLWALRAQLVNPCAGLLAKPSPEIKACVHPRWESPYSRMEAMRERLAGLAGAKDIADFLLAVFWRHRDIPKEHLDCVRGIHLLSEEDWPRSQEWDTIFSFYDPEDGLIKIRRDICGRADRLEIALLVALGQSLLGNYAASKEMVPVHMYNETLGKVYYLTVRPAGERLCYFSDEELDLYLVLTRMTRSTLTPLVYHRLVNAQEGFTPPGLLFGLVYAWYLDNRFAAHIEYKMSIMKNEPSDLIHEQGKILGRRHALIKFFRTKVFRHDNIPVAGRRLTP